MCIRDRQGLDIGSKTAELFADAVRSAKTVVWNLSLIHISW